MKLALSTALAALLLTAGAASAQDSGTTGGALCSDLTALDSASQTAFLQGYEAGMRDANMSGGMQSSTSGTASTDSTAAATDTTAATDTAASTTTDTTATTDAAAATDTATTSTAGTDTAASTTDTAATTSTDATSGSTTGSTTGSTDYASILTQCAGAPTSTISSFMSGGMATSQ